MRIDTTVNIGQIITIGSVIVGATAAFYTLKSDIDMNRSNIVRIENSVLRQETRGYEAVNALNSIKTDIAILKTHIVERDRGALPSSRRSR